MRRKSLFPFVLLLGSCQLFESRDMQPIADLAQQQLQVNRDFAAGWRGVLDKATVDPVLKAQVIAQIQTFEERSQAYAQGLLDFAAKAGKVDWRSLYEQIKGAVKP
mgnify:CR=1 FL=1